MVNHSSPRVAHGNVSSVVCKLAVQHMIAQQKAELAGGFGCVVGAEVHPLPFGEAIDIGLTGRGPNPNHLATETP